MTEASIQPPSRIRHFVVLSLMMMAMLLYLDRFCVGMAEPYIKQDLGLSTFQIGIFFSAFFFTYALGQVPSGWLSDRFGARGMLTMYILTWSLFTALMGVSYGFGMLLLMRAAYGIGQAGAYPTSASVLSKWIPFSGRGTASSLVAFGGRLGGAIAPPLTALLIVWFVPAETSSRLDQTTMLDTAAICTQLSGDDLAAPYDHIRAALPTAVTAKIDTVADEYQPIAELKKSVDDKVKKLQKQFRFIAASRASAELGQQTYAVPAGVTESLIAAFNELIDGDTLYDKKAFGAAKNLDRAAIQFMAKVDKGHELGKDQRQRFHRLLLESCFPSGIGKVYVAGWRPVMIVYGAFGILVAAVYFAVVRNRPKEHPRCNSGELALIETGRPKGSPSPHGKVGSVPWGRLLSSPSMWLNCFAQVGTNIGWVFLVTWFPRYLLEAHQVPILERGLMASVPLFAGWLGMLGGGRLTDWLVGRVGLKWGRRIPWSFSRFLGMAAFLLCPWLDDPWAVTAALSVVAISTDLGTASSWAFCQDVGGKYVGSVLGWGNMWGNLGATVSPILLAWVFDTWTWTVMFGVCAAAFFAAGSFALFIDATIPIAPEENE